MSARERSSSPEEKLLRILQHPLRKRLLRLYVEEKGMLRPKELADFTKKHLSNVGYHVRVLAEQGAVEIVAEQCGAARSSTSTRRPASLTKCPGGGRR
jgi:DNA-binding transcriptional ArsR family regulator